MGAMLAQQLVGAGEHVVDVPAKLSARVRLLERGRIDKSHPNDARSAAIVAWRTPAYLWSLDPSRGCGVIGRGLVRAGGPEFGRDEVASPAGDAVGGILVGHRSEWWSPIG